jgi:hypothetical protein
VKSVLSLVVALGLATLFSSAALAGADCAYHQTQAAVTKTDASKNVATAPADTTDSKVQTAQVDQSRVKSAPVKK